ncbi:putative Inositol 2-dehydrogenase [Rubrivivax sp. A210]|nr:putative Inositol 2-dehydrogenase [Rubrivivax sp. A210]
MTPANTLRVGIAGLGRLGKRHAELLRFRARGATLVSACSPVPAERVWARNELGVNSLHEDFNRFVRDPQIDAVVLVTPTTLHADQAIAARQAGKHVFIEKPLALGVENCQRVETVARQHPGQVAMVGFVRRFDPSYARAQAEIASGAIGRPFMVSSQTCDRNDPDGFFVRFAPTSGGIFMDCSVQGVDLARWMLGRPRATRVFASGTIAIHEGLRLMAMSTTASPSSSSRAASVPCSTPRAPLPTATTRRPRSWARRASAWWARARRATTPSPAMPAA